MPFTYRPFCQWLELFSHSSCFISMDSQLGDNASSKWISLKAHLEMLRGSLHPTASAQMHGADLKATMSVPECIRLYSKNDHTDVNSEKKDWMKVEIFPWQMSVLIIILYGSLCPHVVRHSASTEWKSPMHTFCSEKWSACLLTVFTNTNS